MTDDVAEVWGRIVHRLSEAVNGEFEILREIGAGGMAAVYLAREIALNRQVAIKVMSPALLTGQGMVERFKQEARTIAALDHPNIITIYGVGDYDDLHYFVMKFIQGRSLEHVIRAAGPLPIPMVRGLLFMIGSALDHAHRRNVIHRDIKPANILIDGQGNAIVTDFGIAKVAEDQNTTQKHSGVIIGTPAYMSPEQCYAQPAKAASDQYSLGIVAYEMLTGHPPFTGSQFVVMQSQTERPVPPIREQRRDCPAGLESAILRMLAKDPAERWSTMQHALAELGAAPLLEDHPVRAALARLGIPDDEKREKPEPVPEPYISTVAILAPPEWIEQGDELTLRASARNWAGDTMPGTPIRWHSDSPNVATIDEITGKVRALTPGSVVVTASFEAFRSSVTLQVVPKRVATVNVLLPSGPVHAGDRVQLSAVTQDKHHETLKRAVAWMTSAANVATVSESGVLSAKAPGMVLVFAEADGSRGSIEISVAPTRVARLRPTMAPDSLAVGGRFALGATPLDARDGLLLERHVVWSSGNPKVATVTPDGVVTAVSPGHVDLTCSCEGRTASVEITVEGLDNSGAGIAGVPTPAEQLPAPAKPHPVPERPAAAPAPRGELSERHAPAQPAGQASAIGGTPVATKPTFKVTRRGAMIGGGVGLLALLLAVVLRPGPKPPPPTDTTKIEQQGIDSSAKQKQRVVDSLLAIALTQADSAKKKQASAITNTGRATDTAKTPSPPKPPRQPTVATVVIVPSARSMRIGDSLSLQAILRDSLGRRLAGAARWQSSDPSVAIVDAEGRIAAKKAGSVVIRATSGSHQAERAISIVAPPPDTATKATIPPSPPAPKGFNESARLAIAQFTNAIKDDNIAAVRGKMTQQLADDLARRIAGVGAGKIVVTIRDRDIVLDSAKSIAVFRMRIDDAAKRPLLDFADFKATFSTSVRGWRLSSIDRIQ